MKIHKELKYATFEYEEESKDFSILTKPFGESTSARQSITLNKVYAFAFMRFVIRMAQRNWLRTKPPQEDPDAPYTGLTPQDIGPNWRDAQLTSKCQQAFEFAQEDQDLPLDHPDQTEFTY